MAATSPPAASDGAASPLNDQTINDGFEQWTEETIPPHIFDQGTFAPGYLEDFTLPPGFDPKDLPWFLKGGTLAPEFYEGGTAPPWLAENKTIAPGAWKDGSLDTDVLAQDWTKDLLPHLGDFNFGRNATADPVFLPERMVEYHRSPASAMAGVPRFGMSRDVTAFGVYMSEDQGSSAPVEYLVGLSITSGFLLCVFLAWSVALCILSCSAKGVKGGHPFAQPRKQNGDAGMWARMVFAIAGILLILFTVLFGVMGIGKMQDTTTTIETTTLHLREILMEATNVSLLMRSLRDLSSTMKGRLEREYAEPCPGFEAFDSSDLGKAMNDAFTSTTGELEKFSIDVGDAIDTLQQGIENVQYAVNQCDAAIEHVDSYEWTGQLVALPFIILTGMFLFGVFAADRRWMREEFECFLSWVVLPLFITFIVIAIVLCNVMLVVAAANGDFCGGKDSTPDQYVLGILANSDTFSPDKYLYKAVEYYVYQCTDLASEDPTVRLREYEAEVDTMDQVLLDLLEGMTDSTIDRLSFGCQNDFVPLRDSVEEVQVVLDLARQSASAIFKMMECKKLSIIYTGLFYEGTCTHTIEGFTWTFSCLLVISFMGMIMITLRSAYLNTRILQDEPEATQDAVMNGSQEGMHKDRSGGNKTLATVPERDLEEDATGQVALDIEPMRVGVEDNTRVDADVGSEASANAESANSLCVESIALTSERCEEHPRRDNITATVAAAEPSDMDVSAVSC